MENGRNNISGIWKPFLIAAAIVFLYWAVLGKLGVHWWNDENYSHGLLVPFVVGYIVWTRRGNLSEIVSRPSSVVGGLIVVSALGMLLAGTLGAELFLQRISFVLMTAGILTLLFGQYLARAMSVPFLLFLLAIPIPQIIFNKIAFPLQIYASQFAVWGIRIFGIPTVRKGNVIEILPEGSVQAIALEVVEACSGIRSLMTLVTLALVLAFFTRTVEFQTPGNWFSFLKNRDVWRGAILMLLSLPIAVLTNGARVTSTGIMTYRYGSKALEGFVHELSGWLVYVFALLLLMAANVVLMKLLGPAEPYSDSVPEPMAANSNFVGKPALILLLVLLSGGFFINWLENRGEIQVERKQLSELPAQFGDWTQKGDPVRFSPQTESVLKTTDYVMREYQKNGRTANLYIGYYASQKTGATYHSPQNCLPGSGWEMKAPDVVTIKRADGTTFEANRYIIENGKYKEVMIYWYQGRGRTSVSEYFDKIFTVLDSVTRRRSDGSMIRVMTTAANSEKDAEKAAIELSSLVSSSLDGFVPE
ncbi:MAG: EpsI family protein [Pyrinomonadaceae bacterium]